MKNDQKPILHHFEFFAHIVISGPTRFWIIVHFSLVGGTQTKIHAAWFDLRKKISSKKIQHTENEK